MIKVIRRIREMKKLSDRVRKRGLTVGFVPTMGYLHEGHLSLVRRARKDCDFVVVSIFVNPIQFGPGEDLKRYPRDFSRDKRLLSGAGVDAIYYPNNEEMYPDGYRTYIYVSGLSDVLCGAARCGHFRGVATVVAKLFNVVKPDITYFGQKDFQQQVIVKRMAGDLDMDVKVVSMPTVREADGLAMSSRNTYLKKSDRAKAAAIYGALKLAKDLVKTGMRSSSKVKAAMLKHMSRSGIKKVDYIAVCDTATLEEKKAIKGKTLIATAAYVGGTRLIDNIVIN